jgi:hypothetical protein
MTSQDLQKLVVACYISGSERGLITRSPDMIPYTPCMEALCRSVNANANESERPIGPRAIFVSLVNARKAKKVRSASNYRKGTK